MILDFKIDKTYLLVHALKQRMLPFLTWGKLKESLETRFPKGIELLTGGTVLLAELVKSRAAEKIIKEYIDLIKDVLRSAEFRRLYVETASYKNWLEKLWEKKGGDVLSMIRDISGLVLLRKRISVFVTHPKLLNGRSSIERNAIYWGHPEDWKNHSLVYLAHEILHILTKDPSNLMHALIELLADNEIRIRLNKKGDYFKEGRFDVGHKNLLSLEKQLLPYWKDFLDKKGREENISELATRMKKRFVLDSIDS